MADVDWNATMSILDTLSEGGYSFTELDDYICRHHPRDEMRVSLELLSSRGLICVFEGEDRLRELSAEERLQVIKRFDNIAGEERRSSAAHWINLTPAGEQLLSLIGVGHPTVA